MSCEWKDLLLLNKSSELLNPLYGQECNEKAWKNHELLNICNRNTWVKAYGYVHLEIKPLLFPPKKLNLHYTLFKARGAIHALNPAASVETHFDVSADFGDHFSESHCSDMYQEISQQPACEGCDATGSVILVSESGSDLLIYSSWWFKTPINTEEGKSYFPILAWVL